MKTRFRNVLSVLLAVCMLISLIPATVMAVEGESSAAETVVNGAYTDGVWAPGGTGTVTYTVDGTELKLSKTAEPVAGMENTFDVTLRVESSTRVETMVKSGAAILVIDCSESMKCCAECGGYIVHEEDCKHYSEMENAVLPSQTRMAAAKRAAREFLKAYAGTDANAKRELAIIGFGTTFQNVLLWSNVAGGPGENYYDLALTMINSLVAVPAGSNLDGGLYTALWNLYDPIAGRFKAKNVIVLTDGAPTLRMTGGDGVNGSPENNAAAAVQAKLMKKIGAKIYTVCFGEEDETTYPGGPTVGDYLKDSIASSAATAYNADNTDGLIDAFRAISEEVIKGMDCLDCTAVDPMADMISVTGTLPDGFTTEDGNTYTWVLDEAETKTEGNVTTYVYTCTYRVTLDVLDPDFEEGKFFPTNQETELEINGEKYPFPVPGVQGVLPRTSVTVSKLWSDGSNADGIRPAEITVKLLADGEDTGLTKVLNEANQWTATFEDLVEYKAGAEIAYTVEEVAVDGYAPAISGDQESGFVITNTHAPTTVVVSGSKTWNDGNNQDGIRPESITINLLKNGTVVETRTVTAEDNWAWTFSDLNKYENGVEIEYTITEGEVEGYTASYDGYDVVNTYVPEEISISVTKTWADSNDKDGIRPNEITVKLIADGKDTGKTLTLSKSGKWSGSFTNLPKNADGKAIVYTVEEVEVKGYTYVVKGNMTDGFEIVNNHITIPQTGDNRMPMLWIALMLISGAAIVVNGIFSRKRKNAGQ